METKKRRPTIYDIAKQLNITPATVSRALNNNKLISTATKNLVADAAQKLNYKPNSHAYNLRTGGSKTIGVIVPQVNINFFSNIIAGIEEVARQHKYNIIICQSDDQFEREQQAIETLINQNVACIMLSLAGGTTNTQHLLEAMEHDIQLIQFDRTDSELPTDRVINEIDNTVHAMIEHLCNKGYQNIAYLAGPQNIDIFRKRKHAFERSLLNIGLAYYPENVESYDLTRQSAKQAAYLLLNKKNRPDAIFASSDLGALGACDIAKNLGLSIPNDLGVCGFSNELYTELISPSITTVNQFSLEMGNIAGNIFFDSLKVDSTTKTPQTMVIHPELILRESTNRYGTSQPY